MKNLRKSATTSLKSSNSSIKSTETKKSSQKSTPLYNESNSDKQTEQLATEPATTDKRSSGWVFGWGSKESAPLKQKLPSEPLDEGSSAVISDEDNLRANSAEIANDNLDYEDSTTEQQEESNSSSNKRQNDGWINWGRKLSRSQNLSSDSLRKLFLDGKSQSPQSLDYQQLGQPSNELLSQPKAIITKDTQGKPIEIKNTRSLSWSFWNSTNVEAVNNEDAILFEPSKPSQTNRKSSTTKSPQLANIIVPNIEEVLPHESLINKLSNMVSYSQPKHLQLRKPKSFKRVLIVGVHGFFPNKMLRPLIGEPTGTSIKFATEAEIAVVNWAKKHDLDISIQKVALEKEGKIFDRVDYFFKIMQQWKDEINKSDFIFFACHSQGTPVTLSLLSKLIESGVIENDKNEKKLGILAMAGVNNGPYYGVDQKFFVRAYSAIEHESMKELFELQNFNSKQSKRYLESLRIVIAANTKICFVGSIDDQLVPLYSAIASHIEHPNVYRACYIDGGSNTPTFISRVVAVSLWLKNIGFSDHGVIKQISNSLAGPLTGGGHSKIYNDPNVYELGINFVLSTNDLNVSNPQPVHFKRFDFDLLNQPYHLPWCMHGLVIESKRRIAHGLDQIDKISLEFDQWKPESKVLKDLKYRLSAIRAKL